MSIDRLKKEYLPMSESAYYILLSLSEARHGYGIIKHIGEITGGRVQLGAGTIYGTISRFEKDRLIVSAGEEERRKMYIITGLGRELLHLEILRIRELCENGRALEEVRV